MKITVIGAGNMGGALIKGWCKANLCDQLTITAHTEATISRFKESFPSITALHDNVKAVEGADVVVLAVKPWLIDSVIAEISQSLCNAVVVSVAANARNERIDIYAMPNIAAEFGESMTFIEECDNLKAVDIAAELFGKVGKVQVVPARQMQGGMMLAGCGIAYVMRFIRGMMEGGVELGLYPDQAKEIAMQTMLGAVTLLNETGLHPEQAIDKVTTPGGVTIKGLNELDKCGFNAAIVSCLKAGLAK